MEQCNVCAKLSNAKQEIFHAEVINSSASKQKFGVVDKLLDKKDARILPSHTNPVAVANNLNNYFIDKIDKLRESFSPLTGKEILLLLNYEGKSLRCLHRQKLRR